MKLFCFKSLQIYALIKRLFKSAVKTYRLVFYEVEKIDVCGLVGQKPKIVNFIKKLILHCTSRVKSKVQAVYNNYRGDINQNFDHHLRSGHLPSDDRFLQFHHLLELVHKCFRLGASSVEHQ